MNNNDIDSKSWVITQKQSIGIREVIGSSSNILHNPTQWFVRLGSNAEANGVVNMNTTFKPRKLLLINLADTKWYECGNDVTIFSFDRQDTTTLNRNNCTETILKIRNLADLILPTISVLLLHLYGNNLYDHKYHAYPLH